MVASRLSRVHTERHDGTEQFCSVASRCVASRRLVRTGLKALLEDEVQTQQRDVIYLFLKVHYILA
jgi:hypothetical protein